MGAVVVIFYHVVLELERTDNAVGGLDSCACTFLVFDYVSWNGDVKCLIVVVPFQFDTAIKISCPIFG